MMATTDHFEQCQGDQRRRFTSQSMRGGGGRNTHEDVLVATWEARVQLTPDHLRQIQGEKSKQQVERVAKSMEVRSEVEAAIVSQEECNGLTQEGRGRYEREAAGGRRAECAAYADNYVPRWKTYWTSVRLAVELDEQIGQPDPVEAEVDMGRDDVGGGEEDRGEEGGEQVGRTTRSSARLAGTRGQ